MHSFSTKKNACLEIETMCVIVDVNCAFLVFVAYPHADFIPLSEWLSDPKKDGCVVVGGQLSRELGRRDETRRYILGLARAGRAKIFPDSAIHEETVRLRRSGGCRCNDPHIIALARKSGARTLCSQDKKLHADFKNRELVCNPRGAIYQEAAHASLLKHTQSCGRGRGKG